MGSTRIENWSTANPYFTTPNFNPTTGLFTVPATGRYCFEATINYSTDGPLTNPIIETIDPLFTIRRVAPNSKNLINGLIPILNVNILAVLVLRTILGNGSVTLAGEVELSLGDVIELFYEADDLTVPLKLGGDNTAGIVWSCHRLN
ncbi:hypothetical protein [Solibacillus cecembensis]|uniref:hypothetical protein n=1 Tax=Solibacillus cecembensis TaxID=459347 RepID=UPI003D067151